MICLSTIVHIGIDLRDGTVCQYIECFDIAVTAAAGIGQGHSIRVDLDQRIIGTAIRIVFQLGHLGLGSICCNGEHFYPAVTTATEIGQHIGVCAKLDERIICPVTIIMLHLAPCGDRTAVR